MKITVSICKLTQLRSDARRAFLHGTKSEQQDAGDKLLDHMHARYRAGNWTAVEEEWLNHHPRFVSYCELADDMRIHDLYDELRNDMLSKLQRDMR